MKITLDLGTHQIDLFPDGETLRAYFTWHESIIILSWTCQGLIRRAEASACDSSYLRAEQAFIRLSGEQPRLMS